MGRVREKTSTCQPEHGQMVERRTGLFVVTDGHTLGTGHSQSGCEKNTRPDCGMREAMEVEVVLSFMCS